MTPEQFLSKWLREFSPQFIENRKRDVRARDLDNSGALERSLRETHRADEGKWAFMMTVYFRLYGRYQDMKRDYRGHAGGSDMVKALGDWAEREGLAQFRRPRKSDGELMNMSDERLKNWVAWGIIKKYNTTKPKKRRWWNRGKTRDINQGYRELLKGFREVVQQNAKDFLQNAQ